MIIEDLVDGTKFDADLMRAAVERMGFDRVEDLEDIAAMHNTEPGMDAPWLVAWYRAAVALCENWDSAPEHEMRVRVQRACQNFRELRDRASAPPSPDGTTP